jgi:hypothetical protein
MRNFASRLTIMTALAALGIGSSLMTAEAKYHKFERSMDRGVERGAPSVGEIVFDEIERRLIREYFAHHPEGGGPAGRGLPPGIAKNLARGKPLPPGIAKQFLPGELEGRLPRRPGYERLIVGDSVYLIEQATGLILDILEGVLTPGR